MLEFVTDQYRCKPMPALGDSDGLKAAGRPDRWPKEQSDPGLSGTAAPAQAQRTPWSRLLRSTIANRTHPPP